MLCTPNSYFEILIFTGVFMISTSVVFTNWIVSGKLIIHIENNFDSVAKIYLLPHLWYHFDNRNIVTFLVFLFHLQTLSDCNCFNCLIPLYGNNVFPPIMCHFNIYGSWYPPLGFATSALLYPSTAIEFISGQYVVMFTWVVIIGLVNTIWGVPTTPIIVIGNAEL